MLKYFQKIKKIGEGASGVVYKGRNVVNKKLVALKKIKKKIPRNGIPFNVLREISVLKQLHHPNIVNLQNVFITVDHIYLVFEYHAMDLRCYLDELPSDIRIEESTVRSYVYQISVAVAYCHQRSIFHRDLNPGNILLNQNGMIKIADFGTARSFNVFTQIYTREVATLWYRPPEILLGTSKYTTAIDVWSIGCIFAELFLREPIFQGDSEINQLQKIFEIIGSPDRISWPEIVNLPYYFDHCTRWQTNRLQSHVKHLKNAGMDLFKQMLICNPNKRISAKRALDHQYFSTFNKRIFLRRTDYKF